MKPDPVLEATDLHKTFRSGTTVIPILQGVTLQLMPGESIAITGESGCGKTTLLHCLAALEPVDSGELIWNQQRLNQIPQSKWSKLRGQKMGLVFQNYHLVPELSAMENVRLAARIMGKAPSWHREKAESLLDAMGLADRRNHPVNQLSGGEKQRVAIARAMVNQPPVLLADEPTGNLDEKTSDKVFSQLFDLVQREGCSLLLVTHNPEQARAAHRTLILSAGHCHPAPETPQP